MRYKILLTTIWIFSILSIMKATTVPRSEYPRPQFVRPTWINLNGEWDYTFDFTNTGLEKGLHKADSFEQKIIVPFCPESKLSKVNYTDFINNIWYHRIIQIPTGWLHKNIYLHFGAVYFNSEIYIDGLLVGRHFGGSSSFSFDITEFVKDGQAHHLIVRANSDLRSMKQSAGKQSLSLKSQGCQYTRTTGIWQTVWMEAIAEGGLKSTQVITDIDQKQLIIHPKFLTNSSKNTLQVQLYDGKKMINQTQVKANNSSVIVLPINKLKLWSPESPFLYDIIYQVIDKDGNIIDKVKSYVGMRKIHIEGNKIYLNNKPYYQRLVLDQGFYPDGIWTAPSDNALKKDIELSMAAGFNGARLHQKAFEERFYYWADKLGYLTWGEAPSWGMNANDVEVARNFLQEWTELVIRDRNHPSLIIWTPMNEEWRPDNVQYPRLITDIYDLTKTLDPTRPINDASGGCHIKTDIWTVHSYEQDPQTLKQLLYKEGDFFQTPNDTQGIYIGNVGFNNLHSIENYPFPKYSGDIPYIIDEFGGIKWVEDKNKNNTESSWGYSTPPLTKEEFLKRLEGQVDAILSLKEFVWGYCYTQLTDVEQEQNGIFYYDRRPKFDLELIYRIFNKE